MMRDAGFAECQYHNMTGGIVAVHRALKRDQHDPALLSAALAGAERH